MQIEISQEEWEARNEIESDLISRAYALTGLDWECYSTDIDDDNMLIIFTKNNLEEVDDGDCVARWEQDEEYSVAVEIIG